MHNTQVFDITPIVFAGELENLRAGLTLKKEAEDGTVQEIDLRDYMEAKDYETVVTNLLEYRLQLFQ
jgi:hypothetical protein